jgi:hypothetical protein
VNGAPRSLTNVALPVAVGLGGLDHLLDLPLGEVFAWAKRAV